MAVLASGGQPRVCALRDARVMLLGGARFTTPRHIWWNFVASTPERIEQAKQRWKLQQFPAVPGETEFIPLPQP
jgi:redox-sensitive bicupin YhaK (pirin superfamily)